MAHLTILTGHTQPVIMPKFVNTQVSSYVSWKKSGLVSALIILVQRRSAILQTIPIFLVVTLAGWLANIRPSLATKKFFRETFTLLENIVHTTSRAIWRVEHVKVNVQQTRF